MTTTKKTTRRPTKPRPNALLTDEQNAALSSASTGDSEHFSAPSLDLTLNDLKIIVDALLGLPNSPENIDVYYKIETYRQALKESMK